MDLIDKQLDNIISTDSAKISDDSLKENAEFADRAGLEVRVTRVYDGVGLSRERQCQWCLDRCGNEMTLAEAYERGAFQRHPGCGCIIEYTSAKGERSVQTGKYSGWNFADELEKRKSIGLNERFFADELASRIEKYAEESAEVLYENAKNGGTHVGTYKQAIEKPRPQLESSIKSHIKQVEEHEWKLQHPEIGMKREDPNDPVARARAMKKWYGDRFRNAQEAAIEVEVWRQLYGK